MAAAAEPALAQASAPSASNAPASTQAASGKSGSENVPADQAERLAKRRERLEQGAKRLRERAAELRKRIANGETAPAPKSGKRPPRSLEDQARRFEEQANKMELRAKNLTLDDVARGDRSEAGRKRRHQLRRSHLNRRWGAALRDPDAVAELKVHAERVARLKRIRTLATQKTSKDDPIAVRAKALLDKEEKRHEQRMKEIQSRVAAAAAPNEPAAATEEAK